MQGAHTEPDSIAHYEGLVRSSASRYVSIMAGKGMDFDDICQVFRIKVWKALEAYDPTRCRTSLEKWVFLCVRNEGKDLVKRRHPEFDALHIEDVAPVRDIATSMPSPRDAFEMRYLSADEDSAFEAVLNDKPHVPNTLNHNERRVLILMYNEYRQAEIGPKLNLSPGQVKTAVKGIRAKMADWCPTQEPTPVAASAA